MNKAKEYIFNLFNIKYVKCHLCNKVYYFDKYSSNIFCCNEDFCARKFPKCILNKEEIRYNFRLENNFYQIKEIVQDNIFVVHKCIRLDLKQINYNGFKYIDSKYLYYGKNLNLQKEIQRLNNLIIFE